jgi:hypothetical protein
MEKEMLLYRYGFYFPWAQAVEKKGAENYFLPLAFEILMQFKKNDRIFVIILYLLKYL